MCYYYTSKLISWITLFYLNNGGNMCIRYPDTHISVHVDVYTLILEIGSFSEIFTYEGKKINQSHYRLGVAQRVPGC